jgi:hypothetical protein
MVWIEAYILAISISNSHSLIIAIVPLEYPNVVRKLLSHGFLTIKLMSKLSYIGTNKSIGISSSMDLGRIHIARYPLPTGPDSTDSSKLYITVASRSERVMEMQSIDD